jgi:hypothetical protein
MRLFLLSARKTGLTPLIIPCTTINEKPQTFSKALNAVNDDDLLIATDAFDVLCLAPATEIVRRFEAYGKRIVFGAERVSYHHLPSTIDLFRASPAKGPYRYLNGGVFIGYAGDVKRMLSEMDTWDKTDLQRAFASGPDASGNFNDQTLFGSYAARHPELVALDTYGRICWNPHGEFDELEKTLEHSTGEIVNPLTNVQPCFLHVTQISKYYPLYLTSALVLGLPLNGATVDVGLFDQHMTNTVEHIDRHEVDIDPRVARVMAKSLAYRRLKARQAMIAWYRKIRMDIGRRRRTLLRTRRR